MQTSNHLVVDACAEVGVLGYWQTAVVVIGNYGSVSCHWDSVAYIAILESLPVDLICTDRPVETWVECSVCGFFSLEKVIEPRRSREVSPTTKVARTEVTLDGVSLCGVWTGVHRCPLVIGTL